MGTADDGVVGCVEPTSDGASEVCGVIVSRGSGIETSSAPSSAPFSSM